MVSIEVSRHSTKEKIRSAEIVMSPRELGSRWTNALSFSRAFFRKMVREQWHVKRVSFDLDEEGRGNALYRLAKDEWTFHLVVVSNYFDEGIKVDRSYGINWDVSVLLVQGEWTPEREASLRPQTPKQYEGRFDSNTLCFSRGNRSERIFDHVVDCLANGKQPNPETIAPVGYILRTTAFAGNGLFGTTPFTALPPEHPLGPSYYIQMATVFLMREFVFDLVDHLAKARSPNAVRLDPRIKRYLGIGNSAGLGLIPFPLNHPHILHQWSFNSEQARNLVRHQTFERDGAEFVQFLALLDKAIRYFEEDGHDGNEIFLSASQIASELGITKAKLEDSETADGLTWADVIDPIISSLHLEVQTLLHSVLLEIYPNVVSAFDGLFNLEEKHQYAPQMKNSELRTIIETSYSWAATLDPDKNSNDFSHFWYYPSEALDEPRRGRRGHASSHEFESNMDIALRVSMLYSILKESSPSAPVAQLLANHPQVRSIVQRVQSLVDYPYSEFRINILSGDFEPFDIQRYVLTFLGMEKLDPRPPRSLKGALLQGAPLAEDIGRGQEGTWPFPVMPKFDAADISPTVRVSGPWRSAEIADGQISKVNDLPPIDRTMTAPDGSDPIVFPIELRRLIVRILLCHGYHYGVAQHIYSLIEFSEVLSGGAIAKFLGQLTAGHLSGNGPVYRRQADLETLDAQRNNAFGAVPAALDIACVGVAASGAWGSCRIIQTSSAWGLEWVVAEAASRGHLCVASWQDVSQVAPQARVAVAGAEPTGSPWLATCADGENALDAIDTIVPDGTIRVDQETHVSVQCSGQTMRLKEFVDLIPKTDRKKWHLHSASDLKKTRLKATQEGFRLPSAELSQLFTLSKQWLLPDDLEQRVR